MREFIEFVEFIEFIEFHNYYPFTIRAHIIEELYKQ